MSAIPFVLSKITSVIAGDNLMNSLSGILHEADKQRIANIQKYWTFYNHDHYADVAYKEEDLPFNPYCTAFIQKVATWMVGIEPKYHARQDIAQVMNEIYAEILENSGKSLHFETVEMGSVTGDALLAIQFDTYANDEQGGVSIKLIESDKMLLEYRNIGQKRILSRVLLFWEELDEAGDVVITAELWDSERVTVYTSGKNLAPHLFIGESLKTVTIPIYSSGLFNNRNMNVKEYENPYGELPFVHIKNLPTSRDVLGIPDMAYLLPQNREIDEQILSYKENVDYHANPVLLMYGVRAKDLEKGGRRTWAGLPLNSKIEYLKMEDTHESILKYIDILEGTVGVSGVSRDILNNKNINVKDSSFASLRLAFLPIVELVERKTMTYAEGFAKAMEKAVRFTNKIYGLGLESLDGHDPRLLERLEQSEGVVKKLNKEKFLALRMSPFYKTNVTFEDHLPRNRALEGAAIISEMGAGLEDIDSGLRRLGNNDVEAKKKEILKTAEFRAQYNKIITPIQPEATAEPDQAQTPELVEEKTGQSAERTVDQRNMKGKGDV